MNLKGAKIFSLFRFVSVMFVIILMEGCGKGKAESVSVRLNRPHNIKGVTSYKKCFGDRNDVHLASARTIGIRPLSSREEAEEAKEKLFHVFSNKYYEVDSLTHSIPYLVPRAGLLLFRIGYNFRDSLIKKGLNPNNIIVTSVLRTKDDVKRLKRRNGNASLNSAHFYGTTFDISYVRFKKIEENGLTEDVHPEILKKVLSEVLRDLREDKKCYVKYELKQGCFHITAK